MTDNLVTQLIATLAARHIHTWNEDAAWRWLQDEVMPNASQQAKQQVADRVKWILTR